MAIAIPVLNISGTESSTAAPAKASFWQRAKARVIDVARRVAKPLAAAARSTKTVAAKLGAGVKRAVTRAVARIRAPKSAVPSASRLWRARRAADSAASKAGAWIHETWTRVVRPFIRLRAVAFAVVLGAISLVVSPVATLVVAFAGGAALWGLSYLVEHFEASPARSARIALKAIETIAQVLKGLAYLVTAALTVALCWVSVPFLVSEVLELTLRYFGVRAAVSYASLAYFALSGNWVLFTLCLTLLAVPSRDRATRSVDKQVVVAGHANRRVEIPVVQEQEDGPRRVRLPKCAACGLDDGGARYGLRKHKGLCGKCFERLNEEEALEAAKRGKLTRGQVEQARKAGVKVSRKVVEAVKAQPINQRVTLTLEQIANLSALDNSRANTSSIHWAETAWWHDRDGKPHPREWLGFVDGRSVASIDYHHEKRNRGYEAWLLGSDSDYDRSLGTFHTLGRSQEVVGDELSDQGNLIGGMLNALDNELPAVAEHPIAIVTQAETDAINSIAVVETVDTLVFVEAETFASPEAHIEHVRKTAGDAAASELEERYLQSMVAAESVS